MATHRPLILTAGMFLILVACTVPLSSLSPVTPTATLIACDEMTLVPNRGSILPTLTPSYPCELENVSKRVDFCLVHASPELSYPCSQIESLQEFAIGEGSHTLLIQRDYRFSRGCWHGTSFEVRSLRVCDARSGESMTLAEDVNGDPIPSPGGTWFAFVAAAPESHGLEPHLFRVRSDGTDLVQLDTQPFPQAQVLAAQILRRSEDGEWLEVLLWDGREGGYHGYRIRPDGSGKFDVLP